MTNNKNLRNYLHRIKNTAKKDYAFAYLAWKKGHIAAEPVSKNISTMSRQAVRINIDHFIE